MIVIIGAYLYTFSYTRSELGNPYQEKRREEEGGRYVQRHLCFVFDSLGLGFIAILFATSFLFLFFPFFLKERWDLLVDPVLSLMRDWVLTIVS